MPHDRSPPPPAEPSGDAPARSAPPDSPPDNAVPDTALPPEPAHAFGGFIGPRTLVSLVRIATPWLFDAPPPERAAARLSDLGAHPLAWHHILLAHAQRPELLLAAPEPDAAARTDYFALCLAAHWASVASYVPTDVDAKIRHALWFEQQPPEELARMAGLALALADWDIRGISARWVDAGAHGIVSGHDGERLSVLCGGLLGLLAAGDAAGAERFEHAVDTELAREAAAFRACAAQPGRELDLLRLAAILTHNAGDVMQGLGGKSGKRVGAAQKDRYGDLARSGPALVGGEPAGTGRARYGGAFLQAAALYRELLASEGHRNYPLREAHALRVSADLLLPLGPFLDAWGERVATHPALSLAQRAEVVAALVHGCKRVRGQQGYDRALAGFDAAHKGGVECDAITDLLPAALRRELQGSERRRARAVRRPSFESSLAKAARRILAGS